MKTFFALPQTTLNLGFSVVCATHGYALIHLTNLSLVPSLVFFSAIILLKVLICAIILPRLERISLVMSNLLSLSSPLLLYPCHLPIHNPTLSPHGFLPSSQFLPTRLPSGHSTHHLQFNLKDSSHVMLPSLLPTQPHTYHMSLLFIQPSLCLHLKSN